MEQDHLTSRSNVYGNPLFLIDSLHKIDIRDMPIDEGTDPYITDQSCCLQSDNLHSTHR